MEYSKYQKLIFNFVANSTQNGVVEAVAGSGKTTTSIKSMKYAPPHADILFAAFNKSIVEELERKVPEGVAVKTMHSIGWSAIRRKYGRDVNLFDGKSMEHAKRLFDGLKKEKWYWGYLNNLVKLADIVRQGTVVSEYAVDSAMNKHGFATITGDEPIHVVSLIESMLRDTENFDFTDMIFVPAVEEVKLPKYDFLFVDELQDLNQSQQAIIMKMMNKDSRFLGVGDSRQAIYGFRGSDEHSFNKFKDMDRTISMPLSICYRCAKNIVLEAKKTVPQIEYHESSEDGLVRTGSIDEISIGDWVICRNTKPLVVLAFTLISDGKPAKIKGREIGDKIISMLIETDVNIQSVALRLLNQKKEKMMREFAERYAMDRPELHPVVVDFEENIDIIEFLFDKLGGNVKSVIEFLKKAFSDSKAEITLSTIHKAKGLENNRVFFLRPDLLPSRFATEAWQKEQEENLRYVAITRAKLELIFINDFQFEKIARQIKK